MTAAGSPAFDTLPIAASDVRAGFKCGVAALDTFFARHALSNDKRGLGKTFVFRGSGSSMPSVVGYYTLSMATAEGRGLPASIRAALPRYPIPVALIGRLAVHEAVRGRGFGARLLGDAIRRILSLANEIGCFGIVVDAKDEAAATFYTPYGFIAVEGPTAFPRRLFLSLTTARESAR